VIQVEIKPIVLVRYKCIPTIGFISTNVLGLAASCYKLSTEVAPTTEPWMALAGL